MGIAMLLTLSGCLNNDWEEKENHEKELIQNYLDENGITEEQKTEGGIYFIEKRAGTGKTPDKDDYVVIEYVGKYIETGNILETSYDSLKADWDNADTYKYLVYGPLKFQYGFSITGMNEGLSLMKEGGRAEMVIPSDKAFYDFNPLVYEVELLKVIRDPVAHEDSVLAEYLGYIGYDTTTAYKDIYFKETVTPDPNDERTVQSGDTVLFRYTGRLVDSYSEVLLDNRVFDTNTRDNDKVVRIVYPNTKLESGFMLALPAGLITALDSMREGTHATAVLPYKQAFDDDGLFSSVYGYTVVPKYQTVVYDIVVEEIRSVNE
jgi:FKBP-type peptidyl-prolyl cis-trans isomerase